MGIMVYCSLWVMQDLYHQPYDVLITDVLEDVGFFEGLLKEIMGSPNRIEFGEQPLPGIRA